MFLFIDDDPMVLKALGLIFGLDSVGTTSFDKGLALAASRQPEVILLDAQLGQQDGVARLQELRQVAPEAKVIVFTGYTTTAQRRAAKESGARAYVDKMHITRIREIVEDILNEDGGAPQVPVLH